MTRIEFFNLLRAALFKCNGFMLQKPCGQFGKEAVACFVTHTEQQNGTYGSDLMDALEDSGQFTHTEMYETKVRVIKKSGGKRIGTHLTFSGIIHPTATDNDELDTGIAEGSKVVVSIDPSGLAKVSFF